MYLFLVELVLPLHPANFALLPNILQQILGIDDRITADFLNFSGGPEKTQGLTDDEIRRIVTNPETGRLYMEILRARTGTTALVALIDPLKSLYVTSLGDCDACKQNGVYHVYLI